MPILLDRFLDDLPVIPTFAEAWDKTVEFAKALGFDFAAYGVGSPKLEIGTFALKSNYPNWWTDYYLGRNMAARDPAVRYCATSALRPTPIGYDMLCDSLAEDEHEVVQGCKVFGLLSGIVVPLRTCRAGIFAGLAFSGSMSRREFERFLAANMEVIQVAALYANQILQALWQREAISAKGLTPRERECLRLAALGQSSKEIARTLRISPATVNEHFAHLNEKLGTKKRAKAVGWAMANGFANQ